jgi:hypothetical protein
VPENWLLVKCNLRYFTKKKNYDKQLVTDLMKFRGDFIAVQ